MAEQPAVPLAQPQPLPIMMIGAAVDSQTLDLLMRVDRIPQIQTYNFQWAIVHGLEQAVGRLIDVIATVPTRDWPFTRKIWFGGKRGQRSEVRSQKSAGLTADCCRLSSEPPARWVQMPMINLLGLKQIGRFLTCLWFLSGWLWRHRSQRNRVVVSYGLIVPHLIPARVLCWLCGAKLVAIVTDPPLTYHDEGRLYRAARWVDRSLLHAVLRRLDGVIALTRPLAERLAPGVPALIMEGIISDEVEKYARGHAPKVADQSSEVQSREPQPLPAAQAAPSVGGTFAIMYAGQLHEDYGVGVLLDAFAQLKGDSWALWLYGGGTMEQRIRQAAAEDPRVTFFGFQPAETLLQSMRQAALMISPRPVNSRSPYQFPSKLIEYLAMGKIVLTTQLPSIPADYYPYLLFFDNMSASHLASRICEAAGWSAAQREQMENHAREFAWGNKTQLHQGDRIYQFLRGVSGASDGTFRTED